MNDPAPAAIKLGARAVKAARIKPHGTVTRQEMERAVAGAVVVTHPRTPHGQALMRALSGPLSYAEGRPGPELGAIRWLTARGQAPTEAATAARVAAAMGWPPHCGTRSAIVRSLARTGWLAFTRDERSLRPGPQATAATAA